MHKREAFKDLEHQKVTAERIRSCRIGIKIVLRLDASHAHRHNGVQECMQEYSLDTMKTYFDMMSRGCTQGSAANAQLCCCQRSIHVRDTRLACMQLLLMSWKQPEEAEVIKRSASGPCAR